MERRVELVSRFFDALGTACRWVTWDASLSSAEIGALVQRADGACWLRVAGDLGVDVTPLGPREREFLAWALSAQPVTEEDDPLAQLRACSWRDLVAALAGRDGCATLRRATASISIPAFPAQLVAIDWPTRGKGPVDQGESAEMMKKIAEAYLEVEAWHLSQTAPLAVAVVHTRALRDAWLSLGHAEMDVRGLSMLAGQLANALRSEALVDARVAISGVIRRPEDAAAGVAMLELARREAQRRNADAVVFGDDPVRMALAWLEEPARTALLRSVAALSAMDQSDWPEGWAEWAEALVRCNLNISEAARSLYMHRNTLLARIEKLREVSGLDARRAADAFALFAAGALIRSQTALD
ncbi:helix-turn-helix domain-containing protein [Alicyclobacillus vulcanalis]|uniref:PucR C-terminal helix-turn-helix domain-containing protein n=1 Tax=Alicyclobacillus vulcanalis TaxID=252246 RepID=A0A1N7PAF5_9BACL|nr:PucR family transcriptional regulator [Alicyclobacillus vulcanalis]SIT07574.1 PucR C-terminal helix-turn-helix domain-containing protein [Alicyclobacillus vulcanalis]